MDGFDRMLAHTLSFLITFLPLYLVSSILLGLTVVGSGGVLLIGSGGLAAVGGAALPYILAETTSSSDPKLEAVSGPELMEAFNHRPSTSWLNQHVKRRAERAGRVLFEFEDQYVLYDENEQRCTSYENKQQLQGQLQGVHEARLVRDLLEKPSTST